jgi:hypothetical protein
MVVEATSQNREPRFALSGSIHRRQAWRPAGLRGVQSILSGIASRTKLFDGQRARLTAWYEQFVQRSQPFIGWEPLTTAEFGAHDTQSSSGSLQSEERISRREPLTISKELPPSTHPVRSVEDQASATRLHRFPAEQRPEEPFASPGSVSGPIQPTAQSMPPGERLAGDLSDPHERRLEAAGQPAVPTAREATTDSPALPARLLDDKQLPSKDTRYATELWGPGSRFATPTQRREEHPLVRPAVRLAILRPINTAAGTVQRKESAPLSSGTNTFSSEETKDFSGPENWSAAARPAVPPRLVLGVSSVQRPEARDGFSDGITSEGGRAADTSSEDPAAVSLRDAAALRNVGALETASLGSSRQAEIPEPSPSLPMALPEVQIRLVGADQPTPATQPKGHDVAEGKRSTTEISKPPAPLPAAPPPLDINAVADKVYQVLQRRHQLERERRGLY